MISKEALVDIINKHNDPNDDTCIFNIQSTSATNFFTGRMIGNIKIEGEDIVFMEFDNTEEELYTIRTGLDNIDVIKYKKKPKMTTLIIQIDKYIDELKEEKFIYDDETLSTPLKELKAVSVDSEMTATKGKFSALQEAVATIRRNRLGIIERLKGFEDTRNKFGKEFGYTETEYVFEDLTKLLDEQSARLTTNTALTTKIDGIQQRYVTLNNLFDLSLTNVKVRDKIIKNLDLKVSIDEITEEPDTKDPATGDQVTEETVTEDQVTELIDESKFTRGFLKNDGTGQIHQPSNVDKELTSDFIRITSNSVYIFKYSVSLPNGKNAWTVWQFYDSNKQPVGGLRGYGRVNDSSGNWSKTSEIIPTDNAAYIRLSFSSFGNGHISFKRGLNPNEVPMYVQDTFGIRSTTAPKDPVTEGTVTGDPVTK